MKRQIILMRHAKSSWEKPGVSDHDRPLNERGRSTAPFMALQLLEHDLLPTLILASTATRVRETLQLMRDAWTIDVSVQFEKSIYLASRETLLSHIRGLDDSSNRAMILGHNPGLSELATWLGQSYLELPTAAVVVFESDSVSWIDAVATNVWHEKVVWIPREMVD